MTGNRVLVVGSYPPVPLPEASATAASVAALAANGATVEVLAPRPCAAHHTASFHSWRGAIALARLARRFDLVVLRIEPGFPLAAGSGRWHRLSRLVALALALRASKPTAVHIAEAAAVPPAFRGAAAGLFWRSAGTVTVGSAGERDQVASLTGLSSERVVVELPRVPSLEPPSIGKLVPGEGRQKVMQIVAGRARAERSRAATLTGTRPPIDPLGPATSASRRLAKEVLERTGGTRATAMVARVRRLLGS